VADQPTVVSESVWEFERSLLEAPPHLLAVCLLSSAGARESVGLVPIVLGVVALVMLMAGWNPCVPPGSLIIALGSQDDASSRSRR
jgi:hypothetical protein